MPRWSDMIELVHETKTRNKYGDAVTNRTYRPVFANKKSIRQSEFYQAQTTDLRPEIMFEIRAAEYDGEERVRYVEKEINLESNTLLESPIELDTVNSREYQIRRVFSRNGEVIELICEGVNNG